MADQITDTTLHPPPTISDHFHDGDSTSDPSLSRNSSFSKLNAQAKEFVPMMIAPPVPAPPPMMAVFSPPPPSNTAFPVPHMHHHHHHNHIHNHHPHYHHHRNDHHRNDHQKHSNHHQKQHQESGDKEQGQGDGGSRNGLSEEAAQKLINQVEYYFSDVNLATTDHLIRFINKDPEGFVPISVVASFKKIKALISSNSQLAAVLRNSTKLVVSEDGKKLKRLLPLTGSDMEELQARIIVAENLPDDHCHQNLMKIFSAVGSVKSIRTCLPQSSNNGASSTSRPSKTDNQPYCNKLHAFVEYESVELAEKAIAELNDRDDWRNGLRVRLLHKCGSKSAQTGPKKAVNEGEVPCEEDDASTSEQNTNEKHSEEPIRQPDVQSHEHVAEQTLEKEGGSQKKGRNRGRGKGRGRGQHQHQHQHQHHNINNRGNHGGALSMNNAVHIEQPIVARQQPPGPRMPDGTRGFSMGRGKPITVNTAA